MKKLLLTVILFSSFGLFSQSILTVGEVYDFEIGDEFQYSIDNYPGTMLERYVVIDKYFSPNNDTVFYRQSVSNYYNAHDGNGGTSHFFSSDTISFYRTNLNDPITTFGDTMEIYDIYLDSTYMYYPDTIIKYDSNLCGLEVNGWVSYPPVFESVNRTRIAGRGVGSVWNYHYDPSSPMPYLIDRRLYYYKKGNITCGTPNTVSIKEIELKNSEIKIYPVPADKVVNIDLGEVNNLKKIHLIDINGKLIPIEIIQNLNAAYSFNSENIPNGIYFVHISTEAISFKKKLIITH